MTSQFIASVIERVDASAGKLELAVREMCDSLDALQDARKRLNDEMNHRVNAVPSPACTDTERLMLIAEDTARVIGHAQYTLSKAIYETCTKTRKPD